MDEVHVQAYATKSTAEHLLAHVLLVLVMVQLISMKFN